MKDVADTEMALMRVGREPDRWALFLDIDGTLLDLAATPDGVEVPPSLPQDLERLSSRLGGAMALVTGRALPYVDALFAPHRFPVAGLHGADIRKADGGVLMADAPPAFEALKEALNREAETMPGVLIEDKGAAVAAHYRLAPQYEAVLGERMQHYAQEAGPGWSLQLGKMVFEIRPSHASKGDAVKLFMQDPAFMNRSVMAVGDDLTDESMFVVANNFDGHSIRVGSPGISSKAISYAPSPAYIRDMIKRLIA